MEKINREVKTKLRLSRNSNVNFPSHVHDDVELVYVIRGGGSAVCDGRAYPLVTDSVFIAFPNQIHSYRDCVEGAYIVLIIKPSRLLYLQEIFSSVRPTAALCQGSASLKQLLLEALQEHEKYGDSYVVDGYLTAFFGQLFRQLTIQKSSGPNDTVSRILLYCSNHYKEAICVQDLCDRLQISRSYVSHMFSGHLKMGFSDYINALRLNEAVSLLEGTAHNVTQVAEQAGFPTIRTFNRVFRKQFGYPPSEHRKKHGVLRSVNDKY